MKSIFGLISLLLTFGCVFMLQHKSLDVTTGVQAAASAAGVTITAPDVANESAKVVNIEQQVKQKVEDSLKNAHPDALDPK